jgi:long-subunit fatty acid transport protein
VNIKVEKYLKFTWLILFPLISIFPANAAEWSVDANINQDISYDDNVTMREEGEESFIYTLTPVVNFAHKTEVSEISANASYGFQNFFDTSLGFRERQRYGVEGEYSLTERMTWGLSADYSVTPSRDAAQEDSGIFDDDTDRTAYSILPSISYKLTEQDNLMLFGGYTDASYTEPTFDFKKEEKFTKEQLPNDESKDPEADFLNDVSSRVSSGIQSDYTNVYVGFEWSRSWSERFTTSLRSSYSHFESERSIPKVKVPIKFVGFNDIPKPEDFAILRAGSCGSENKFPNCVETNSDFRAVDSDSIDVMVSSRYLLFENWELYGGIGGRFTKTKVNVDNNKDNNKDNDFKPGFLFDVGTIYTGESLTADFSISQSNAPSAREGREEEQFRISLDLNYILTERLSTALVSSYQESESISGQGVSTNKRTNFSVQPSVSWRINPDWTVSTSYRYRYQERPIGDVKEEASSNLYMISLNYRWQGLSISR